MAREERDAMKAGDYVWLAAAIASAVSFAVAGEFAPWVASDAHRKGNSDD